MKPSKELKGQLKRLQDVGSFAMNDRLKHELSMLLMHHGLEPLKNFGCRDCVRNACWRLIGFYERQEEVPVLQKPVLKMKMVKTHEELTWAELRKLAKDKGLKTYGKKRQQIIDELNG